MKAEIGRRERKNRTAGKCVYEGCCVAAQNRLFSLTLFVIYSRRGSTLLPRELCMDTCRVGCSAERRGGGAYRIYYTRKDRVGSFFLFLFCRFGCASLILRFGDRDRKRRGMPTRLLYRDIISQLHKLYGEKRERNAERVI
jgi:hypothetical protein